MNKKWGCSMFCTNTDKAEIVGFRRHGTPTKTDTTELRLDLTAPIYLLSKHCGPIKTSWPIMLTCFSLEFRWLFGHFHHLLLRKKYNLVITSHSDTCTAVQQQLQTHRRQATSKGETDMDTLLYPRYTVFLHLVITTQHPPHNTINA